MRCLTLNACKIFCTNFPGCHPPFSYSSRHTLSDYVGGPLCQSGHGYPSRYVRPAAALKGYTFGPPLMIIEILQQYLKMVSSEGYNASVEVSSYKLLCL